jgi:hypothetical protein
MKSETYPGPVQVSESRPPASTEAGAVSVALTSTISSSCVARTG